MLDLAPRLDRPCMRVMRPVEGTVEVDELDVEESFRKSHPRPPPLRLQCITAPPQLSQLAPAMAHSPAPPAASAPLGSPPDSAASVPSNTFATLAASEESGEASEESGEWPELSRTGCQSDEPIEDCPSQKKQNVNMYADNNLLVRKNLLGCKKDPGKCFRSLFSSEVYPATTVVHFAARRRGLARTLSCSLARYSRQTT